MSLQSLPLRRIIKEILEDYENLNHVKSENIFTLEVLQDSIINDMTPNARRKWLGRAKSRSRESLLKEIQKEDVAAIVARAGKPFAVTLKNIDLPSTLMKHLKDALRERHLAVSGKKADLIQRLKAKLKEEEEEEKEKARTNEGTYLFQLGRQSIERGQQVTNQIAGLTDSHRQQRENIQQQHENHLQQQEKQLQTNQQLFDNQEKQGKQIRDASTTAKDAHAMAKTKFSNTRAKKVYKKMNKVATAIGMSPLRKDDFSFSESDGSPSPTPPKKPENSSGNEGTPSPLENRTGNVLDPVTAFVGPPTPKEDKKPAATRARHNGNSFVASSSGKECSKTGENDAVYIVDLTTPTSAKNIPGSIGIDQDKNRTVKFGTDFTREEDKKPAATRARHNGNNFAASSSGKECSKTGENDAISIVDLTTPTSAKNIPGSNGIDQDKNRTVKFDTVSIELEYLIIELKLDEENSKIFRDSFNSVNSNSIFVLCSNIAKAFGEPMKHTSNSFWNTMNSIGYDKRDFRDPENPLDTLDIHSIFHILGLNLDEFYNELKESDSVTKRFSLFDKSDKVAGPAKFRVKKLRNKAKCIIGLICELVMEDGLPSLDTVNTANVDEADQSNLLVEESADIYIGESVGIEVAVSKRVKEAEESGKSIDLV